MPRVLVDGRDVGAPVAVGIGAGFFGMMKTLGRGEVNRAQRDLLVRRQLVRFRGKEVDTAGDGDGMMPRSEYTRAQPFGQIPAIEDGDLTLFESGAIVLYVAQRSAAEHRRVEPAPQRALAEVPLFHPAQLGLGGDQRAVQGRAGHAVADQLGEDRK